MADDLIPRLLEAIEERQKVARAATQKPWEVRYFDDDVAMSATAVAVQGADDEPAHGDVVALTLLQTPRRADVEDGRWDENAVHIALNDPPAVLALCQAHREIVEEYQRAVHNDDPGGWSLKIAVDALARAYDLGVEEKP